MKPSQLHSSTGSTRGREAGMDEDEHRRHHDDAYERRAPLALKLLDLLEAQLHAGFWHGAQCHSVMFPAAPRPSGSANRPIRSGKSPV